LRSRRMTERGWTPRCFSIQSSSEANGPASNSISAPRTSTKNVVAASMSGTVKPTCSTPKRPGNAFTGGLLVIGAVHRHVLKVDLLFQKIHATLEERFQVRHLQM